MFSGELFTDGREIDVAERGLQLFGKRLQVDVFHARTPSQPFYARKTQRDTPSVLRSLRFRCA
jgi:hypothetical protein